MYCVYVAGSSKPRRQVVKPAPKAEAAASSGFFSSLFSSLTSAPRSPVPTPSPNAVVTKEIEQAREAAEQIKLLEVTETSVLLSVFAVDIDVKLDEKMRQELQRATKKNPPSRMRLELIYVSRIYMRVNKLYDLALCRPERMNTMRARRRIASNPRPQAVYSKDYVRTSMGEW